MRRVTRKLVGHAVCILAGSFLTELFASWVNSAPLRPTKSACGDGMDPMYLSPEDLQTFKAAGYSKTSAVYGYASEKLAKKELWMALQKVLGQSTVESFLRSGSFVDLGSGEGELVLTALNLFPSLSKGVGVELSSERHETALCNAAKSLPDIGKRADFMQGDICDESNARIMQAVAGARVLFVSNVMFEKKLIKCLSEVVRKHIASQGRAAIVVTVGKPLDLQGISSGYHSGLMTGSWGLAPSYIYGILPGHSV